MSERDIWDGLPVTFVEFTIREGKAVNAAFAESAEQGSYMLLVLSMQWAETSTPVFASVDEIEALPFRLRPALVRLSNKAATTNGMGVGDDDALVRKPANGHDASEATGPSS
jgi:hypothetical protein